MRQSARTRKWQSETEIALIESRVHIISFDFDQEDDKTAHTHTHIFLKTKIQTDPKANWYECKWSKLNASMLNMSLLSGQHINAYQHWTCTADWTAENGKNVMYHSLLAQFGILEAKKTKLDRLFSKWNKAIYSGWYARSLSQLDSISLGLHNQLCIWRAKRMVNTLCYSTTLTYGSYEWFFVSFMPNAVFRIYNDKSKQTSNRKRKTYKRRIAIAEALRIQFVKSILSLFVSNCLSVVTKNQCLKSDSSSCKIITLFIALPLFHSHLPIAVVIARREIVPNSCPNSIHLIHFSQH